MFKAHATTYSSSTHKWRNVNVNAHKWCNVERSECEDSLMKSDGKMWSAAGDSVLVRRRKHAGSGFGFGFRVQCPPPRPPNFSDSDRAVIAGVNGREGRRDGGGRPNDGIQFGVRGRGSRCPRRLSWAMKGC